MSGDQPFRDLFEKLGVEGSGGGGSGGDGDGDGDGEATPEEAPEEIRAVVLGYRKRAGDSVVTTVRDVPASRRAELLKTLKKSLGCGGTEDGDLLVLQGDRRSQLTKWFEARDVRVRGERG